MDLEVSACDLGLSGGRFGSCAVSTGEPAGDRLLTDRQSVARAAAGVAFGAVAAAIGRRRGGRALGAVAGWFGLSHVVAAVTRFDGCPELGAVPSLVLRRRLATECGPWDYVDRRLGLAGPRQPGGPPRNAADTSR